MPGAYTMRARSSLSSPVVPAHSGPVGVVGAVAPAAGAGAASTTGSGPDFRGAGAAASAAKACKSGTKSAWLVNCAKTCCPSGFGVTVSASARSDLRATGVSAFTLNGAFNVITPKASRPTSASIWSSGKSPAPAARSPVTRTFASALISVPAEASTLKVATPALRRV